MFNEDDFDKVSRMLLGGISTKDAQNYLMDKYKIKRSKTSNFIKKVRRKLGIYHWELRI